MLNLNGKPVIEWTGLSINNDVGYGDKSNVSVRTDSLIILDELFEWYEDEMRTVSNFERRGLLNPSSSE